MSEHNGADNDSLIDDDLIITRPPHLCDSCAKKFEYSIMNSMDQATAVAASNSSHHGMHNHSHVNNNDESSSSVAAASPIRTYRGEKRRTFLAVVYLFVTCLWTSFMLTVVHDRVPDMNKYPPLPDIILDNVPLIPWAFFATECIGIVLGVIFLFILIFHKYR